MLSPRFDTCRVSLISFSAISFFLTLYRWCICGTIQLLLPLWYISPLVYWFWFAVLLLQMLVVILLTGGQLIGYGHSLLLYQINNICCHIDFKCLEPLRFCCYCSLCNSVSVFSGQYSQGERFSAMIANQKSLKRGYWRLPLTVCPRWFSFSRSFTFRNTSWDISLSWLPSDMLCAIRSQ